MLTAAYNVELTWNACTPFVNLLWDKMKQVGLDAARLLAPCYYCDRVRNNSFVVNDDCTQFAFDADDSFEVCTLVFETSVKTIIHHHVFCITTVINSRHIL